MDHPEYLVVGVISALITVYLFVALLFPERF
jgi:K+-transporting ATPase KdpF subunit